MAVGWSSDILPAAKRMSNVAVVVPKSGASIWADFWVCMWVFLKHFHQIFFRLLNYNRIFGHVQMYELMIVLMV